MSGNGNPSELWLVDDVVEELAELRRLERMRELDDDAPRPLSLFMVAVLGAGLWLLMAAVVAGVYLALSVLWP